MNRSKALKLIDRLVGTVLVLIFSLIPNRKNRSKHIKRIMWIRPGGIGDAVLLLPSLRHMKIHYPEAEVDVLCEKRNSGVFRMYSAVSRIYEYDRGLELLKCLTQKYDIVIDTEQWHRLSAVVAYLTCSPLKIGFDTNIRRRLFDVRVQYRQDEYEVYSFFYLIQHLLDEAPVFDDEAFMDFIDSNDNDSANVIPLDMINILAISPGASVKERRWGAKRYGRVAREFSKKGYNIVILGTSIDKTDANVIQACAPSSIDLTGKTNLKQIGSLLKRCTALISADSGLMHIAYLVGTPSVSLFGSGIEKKWAPRGKGHKVINKRLACSPCTSFGYTPECKNGIECLDSISVKDVIAAVDEVLVSLNTKITNNDT